MRASRSFDRLPRRPALFFALLSLALGLVLAAASAGLPALAAAPASPQQADDPALLRELAERLLAPGYGGPRGEPLTAKLYPGRLPEGVSLPFPANARLLGSVVRSGPPGKMGGPGVEIALEIPGSPAEVLAQLRSQLATQGWTTPAMGYGPTGGFQTTLQPVYAALCKDQGWLNLSISGGEESRRDVRVQLNSSGGGPCGAQPPMGRPLPPGMEHLPLLSAPKGIAITTLGMPSGPGRWGSEAIADTALRARDLEAHFAKQLEASGWSRTGGDAQGALAWSTWKVKGDWTGFLFVLESSGGKRELSVRVMSESASGKYPY
jgi:hypothetical protein